MLMGRGYVQDWLGYWGYLSGEATNRWARAMKETRAREYGPEKWISDITGFWDDATTAWWTAVNSQTERPAIVMFSIDKMTEGGASRTVPIFKPSVPPDEPRAIWLGKIGDLTGPGSEMEPSSLDLRWNDGQGGLEIFLKGLYDHKKHPDGLKCGAYQAVVHIGDVPVALVYIHVIERK